MGFGYFEIEGRIIPDYDNLLGKNTSEGDKDKDDVQGACMFSKFKPEIKPIKLLASERQAGGEHYKDMAIQPMVFSQKNNLNPCEANVIKYVCRHRNKGGASDIKKAIHMLELLLEIEYEEEVLK